MPLPRGLPWRRFVGLLCLGALIGVGPGRTFAAFVSSTDTQGSSFSASRIFSGTRSTSAWDVRDAADGSESNESNVRAFADAVHYRTKNWTNSWASDRYLEFEMNSPLAAGLSISNPSLDVTFADEDDNTGNTFCYYFEVRRTSTGALLGTYGSTGAPIACEARRTWQSVSTPISVVPDTDTANDLTIRLFGNHSGGGKAARIDSVNVGGTLYSNPFSLYAHRFVDAADTVAATTRWGPAVAGDGTSYQTVGNWSNNFAANRYLKFTFPAYVPGAGDVTAASIDHWYKSTTSGDTTCWYLEVYDGSTLIATKGSSTTPISCNGTTAAVADNVAIPEVNTPSEANNVVIRVYSKNSGGRKTDHDLVRLNVTYSMGDEGCTNPGTQTLYADADSWTDQHAPNANEGTNGDLKVRSKLADEQRRTFVSFPLPSVPTDCYIASATLSMFQSGVQGTRTLEVYRAASSWTETGITWNNQPATAGNPSTTVGGTGWRQWSVNSQVRNMYSNGNHGFVLRDETEGSSTSYEQKFDSREKTNQPVLVITFNTYTGCDDPGTQTVTVSYDSFTDQKSPDANEGTNSDLKVKAKSATEAKRAFVFFGLPSVPNGCTLTDAKLRLYLNSNQGTRTMEVYRAAAVWIDTTITWNNQPGFAGTPATTVISGTGLKEWTVTTLIQEIYSGSNNGFVVKDSVEDTGGSSFEQKFNALEDSESRPKLLLTFG